LPAKQYHDAVRASVESGFDAARDRLERLVRIPSISAPGFDPAAVRESAQATAEWMEGTGLSGIRLLEPVKGAHPAVFGSIPGPAGSPTVLMYAHHDVQPPGPTGRWDSPPFAPEERDGRLFGRGTADNKAGIAIHMAALQAWNGRPPVGVAVFVEGDEEIASPYLPQLLDEYGHLLAADAIVLADCSNWGIGQPALTTSLRGIVNCLVEVRTLEQAVHSGKYGGPVPDALTTLCRLVATLHDDDGSVAVPGLWSGQWNSLKVEESDLRRNAGVLPEVQLMGRGELTDRLWTQPSISVIGMDAPPTNGAAQVLLPSARAKISIRVAPGDSTERAYAAVAEHLHRQAPWGARVSVHKAEEGQPHSIDSSGPAFESFRLACADSWGCAPVEAGSGGSLPLAAAMAKAYPGTALLLTGVEDPESKAHAANESVHLADLQRCCTTEAMLLRYLADAS
jgi:cysteinylglycine-S-conjugate dipeptidase